MFHLLTDCIVCWRNVLAKTICKSAHKSVQNQFMWCKWFNEKKLFSLFLQKSILANVTPSTFFSTDWLYRCVVLTLTFSEFENRPIKVLKLFKVHVMQMSQREKIVFVVFATVKFSECDAMHNEFGKQFFREFVTSLIICIFKRCLNISDFKHSIMCFHFSSYNWAHTDV